MLIPETVQVSDHSGVRVVPLDEWRSRRGDRGRARGCATTRAARILEFKVPAQPAKKE